ncbi:uncharacterized protein LOC130635816 [Hydractinia symbiolongicarpus]|uniref:uncharacterized protein LOC130635816 n=1 Tax=Hydractinia symbiolongicarpus TaxID=13093 RepID=UPI00254D0D73|nr:uncharacterized protein LOC130635816 [Hydractinia symbiolongicarpus]
MEVHSPVTYHRSSIKSERPVYYGKQTSNDIGGPVILHPLIIGKDIVVCMPEVNRVLRNVYQVLSQANYYLSKNGISSRRYTGAQLIRIKMLGILGHEAKVCSYILQKDAEYIFDSFDVSGDSRKSASIEWMDPVLLDEKPIPDLPKKAIANKPTIPDGPVKVHLFRIGGDIVVCAPDVQKVVQSHFHQGATVGYYFTKLGIVPYKFIHTSHLDKIKQLGIIKKSAVHCTYVLKTDAMRVFDAYGMSQDVIKEKVIFLEEIQLNEQPSHSWKPVSINMKSEDSPSMINSPKQECFSPASVSDKSNQSIPASEDDDEERKASLDIQDMTVHVFIVDKHEVVCMPDIHKIAQSIHGNSIQVNYYFNKLRVQKKRFCFAHLRELKSRNVLQNNATYCTYVPRADAEKLFQIYCLVDDPKLQQISWTEPINLDCKPVISESACNGDENRTEEEVVIHTFSLDEKVVITVPDVHKIVDFLEEQSASLDYHFRKLGIMKHRFTYSQLHQLRRLDVIKRPTVCTYVTREDVDKLISMYETERNKHKILRVKYLVPITLVPGSVQGKPSKAEKSPISQSNSFNDETVQSPTSFVHPSAIREPSPTQFSHSSSISESNSTIVSRQSPMMSPTSAAISHIQNTHPSIDCPIVIPSSDYDTSRASEYRDRGLLNGKRSHCNDGHDSSKRMRYDSDYTTLVNDLNRKEDELRLLHDAYQRDIVNEREKRVFVEMKYESTKDNHAKEVNKLKAVLESRDYELQQLKVELENEKKTRERLEKELEDSKNLKKE